MSIFETVSNADEAVIRSKTYLKGWPEQIIVKATCQITNKFKNP